MQGGGKKHVNPRWIGWLVIVAGLFTAVRVGFNVVRLYRLGFQVQEAEKQLDSEKLRNTELKTKLEVAQTPEFLENEVRSKLGYAREGETVIIIPDEILPNYQPISTDGGEVVPNWQQWWSKYFENK